MSLTRPFRRKRIEPCRGRGKPSHSNETTPASNKPIFARMEAPSCLYVGRDFPRCRASRTGNWLQNFNIAGSSDLNLKRSRAQHSPKLPAEWTNMWSHEEYAPKSGHHCGHPVGLLCLRSRIDFERLTMMVKVKAVNGRIGRVKTECSEDELPLDPDFASLLQRWKGQCRQTPGDWVFPSHITDRCFHGSPIQQDYILPAGRRLVLEGIGWHTFRHRAWLDATGAPTGVQQKLMRHAHVSTTMNIYGNALMESKRDANSKVVRMALPSVNKQENVA